MKTKILIIEDNVKIRKQIASILSLENYFIIEAEDGVSGIELAKKSLPDLIICDILMPEKDGYDVIQEIRSYSETSTIPFIFLTAKVTKEDIRKGMEFGSDDYLTKPFTRDELLNSITAQINKNRRYEIKNKQKMEDLSNNIIYSLPHEFMTPLTSIIGCSELLTETINDNNKDIVKIILNSAKRLEKVLQNYLVYSQITAILNNAEKRSLIQDFNVDSVDNIVKIICNELGEKYNRISDIKYNLGANDKDAKISYENLSKIVYEIFENSIKFSQKSTLIKVSTYILDNYLIIEIEDQGRGMSEEQIKNIGIYRQFERQIFEQQGLGFGLAIVQKLLDLHNGIFSISSSLNEYTKVTIQLKVV